MSLITPYEVVRYSPVQKDYPVEYIKGHINRVETKAFRKCYLGKAFLAALIENMSDLSLATVWDSETTYAKDALINDCGLIYKSLVDGNIKEPADIDSWVIAPKFDTDSTNVLWTEYMAEWLSLEILFTSIRYSTYQAGAKGLVKLFDDSTGIQTVDHQAFVAYKKELRYDADDALDNMYDFMLQQTIDKEVDYTSIQKIATACNDIACKSPRKRRKRRLHFKY